VVWEQLIRNGMEANWFWKHSAAEYTRLCEEIIPRVQTSPVQSVVGESAPLW
jgi:glycogen synthase